MAAKYRKNFDHTCSIVLFLYDVDNKNDLINALRRDILGIKLKFV